MTPSTAAARSVSRRPSVDAVRAWLVLLCAMVFVMVLLGGATRLTGSGLSMVEWQPLTVLPPLGEAAWQAEFAKYQASPEFQHKNTFMTLSGFKGIFWLEYIHRLWGRLIGVAVLLPLAWFALRGAVDRRLGLRMAGLFVLGGLQGALGWYMVRSGLAGHPEVSQYRLAAHLGLAVLLYGLLVWTALTFRSPPAGLDRTGRLAAGVAGMVVVTMISGAFVAGLDAGLTYNTFPLMDGAWVPRGLFVLEPVWRNHFENITLVQFQHRILAMATVVAVVLMRWMVDGHLRGGRQRLAANAVVAMAVLQMALGVATLVLVVPVPVAVAHQGGALMVLSAVLWLMAESRKGEAHGR